MATHSKTGIYQIAQSASYLPLTLLCGVIYTFSKKISLQSYRPYNRCTILQNLDSLKCNQKSWRTMTLHLF